MSGTFSVLGFAGHLAHLAHDAPKAIHAALDQAAEIVEIEAKRVIGTYDYGWPALGPTAVAKHGDTPLLDTGEMRESIQRTVEADRAFVGSNLDRAVYQEMGTSRGIPPRPFLAGAAIHKEKEVEHATGRLMAAFLSGRGIKKGGGSD